MLRRSTALLALLAAFSLVAMGCASEDESADETTTTEAADAGGEGDGGPTRVTATPPTHRRWTTACSPSPPASRRSSPGWSMTTRPTARASKPPSSTRSPRSWASRADAVTRVRTGFDEAIAPGNKAYDFNVQQYSITEERDEVVDFSDGYYEIEQAIIAQPTGRSPRSPRSRS